MLQNLSFIQLHAIDNEQVQKNYLGITHLIMKLLLPLIEGYELLSVAVCVTPMWHVSRFPFLERNADLC